MTKYISWFFDPNEDRNDKTITILENEPLIDTGLFDCNGHKLYRDERIKMGFELIKER